MAVVKNIKKDEPLKLIPWLDEAGEMERRDKEEAVNPIIFLSQSPVGPEEKNFWKKNRKHDNQKRCLILFPVI